MAETDHAKREAEIAHLHQLRTDYEQMLDEDLKESGRRQDQRSLSGELHQSAMEYWQQVDEGLLPLVRKGE